MVIDCHTHLDDDGTADKLLRSMDEAEIDASIVIAETLPGFRIDGWFVVVAPAKTPAPILQRLNREIDAVFKSPEIRQRALGFGLSVSDAGTPDSTAAFIHSEQERWRGLVTELGMEAQ